ncbi:MAG: metalloregulator ArsR/SmtB family transcription factor [Acidobacteriota bacterium]
MASDLEPNHPLADQPAPRADAVALEPCCSLALDTADEARLVALCKALGHPLRFEILKFLVTHPGCITGDLVEHLPIAQATVSQHLKVLKDAGWIQGVVHGPAVCYCLDPERVAWFRRTVREIF